MTATGERQPRLPWFGHLMLLNTQTKDHRILVDDTDDPIATGPLPLPILAERDSDPDRFGTPSTASVGTVEWVGRHGRHVVAAGQLDVTALLGASGVYRELAEDGGQVAVAPSIIMGRDPEALQGMLVIHRPWRLRSVLILREATSAWPDAHLRLAVPLLRYAAPRRWV